MASRYQQAVTASLLLFALLLARAELSSCHVLKGFVSCLDCPSHHDLSGINVAVKCSGVKKVAMVATEADGSFRTRLLSSMDAPSSSSPSFNCLATILGGPSRLFVSQKNRVSRVVRSHDDHDSNSFTIATPLEFYTSCPSPTKCGAHNAELGSSKTIDLPLPPEWGFPPTSYYIPMLPIIGIP